MHGKTSLIYHDGEGIFQGLPQPFEAIRYHSLIVERESLPPGLVPTAQTSKGLIMGLRHASYPIMGVQFHPESIMTRDGKDLLRNFLRLARDENSEETRERTSEAGLATARAPSGEGPGGAAPREENRLYR
jgi:GMP synthase-like glutamine amidotransferase